MQQERDFWWFAASFAYHLVDLVLKLLGFAVVILGGYWAFTTFGGVGLAVTLVLVAAWRLTREIAKINKDNSPESGPSNSHDHK